MSTSDGRTSADLAALAARVDRLEAVEAIRRLKARYAELVDARYEGGGPLPPERLAPIAAEIAALFTVDAVWHAGGRLGTARGREEIRARMAAPTLRASRHYFVNPVIEIKGERARARWKLLAPCTLADGRSAWMAGAEDDEYARVDGRWLHSSMKLTVHSLRPEKVKEGDAG